MSPKDRPQSELDDLDRWSWASIEGNRSRKVGRPSDQPADHSWCPGAIWYAAVVVLGLALVMASSERNMLELSLLGVVGVLVLIVWAVLLVVIAFRAVASGRPVGWLRWMAVPIVGMLFFGFAATWLPFRLRFELSREALTQAAARVTAGEEWYSLDFGLLNVYSVRTLSHGVFIVMNGAGGGGFGGSCGVAYSPDGETAGFATYDNGQPAIKFLENDLGGGWWFACEQDGP